MHTTSTYNVTSCIRSQETFCTPPTPSKSNKQRASIDVLQTCPGWHTCCCPLCKPQLASSCYCTKERLFENIFNCKSRYCPVSRFLIVEGEFVRVSCSLEGDATESMVMAMESLRGSWGNASESWWAVAMVVATLAALVAFVMNLRSTRAKLPPGPRPLPLIGNLHQLGELPHQTLWHMAKKFGPIMYLRMGANPVVIASTADAAQEFLKVQDKSWASRPQTSAAGKVFSNNFRNIGLAPYGPHWRHMRRICMLELFTQKRMDSFRTPRGEEFGLMVKSIYEDSVEGKNVPLRMKLAHLASNNLSRMLLGKRLFGTDQGGQVEAHRLKKLVCEVFYLFSTLNVGDCFPWLKWTTHLTGYVRHLHNVQKDVDAIFQEFLDVKKNGTPTDASRGEDLVDVLLAQPSESGNGRLDDGAIKGVTTDMLLAGSETSSNTVEWAIAALLQHPPVLRKLQAELDAVVGRTRIVTETDLLSLPYLQAVVKETFRLYPPGPISVPHESMESTSVWGYEFPAKTSLLVNFYAIHRDPNVWERPLQFDPERFISHPEIDVRGNHFGLIPFGAGRRQCPAMSLGLLFVQMGVARLVQAFDLGLPNGMVAEELDMSELSGLSMPRKVPLVVVAKARLPKHLY